MIRNFWKKAAEEAKDATKKLKGESLKLACKIFMKRKKRDDKKHNNK